MTTQMTRTKTLKRNYSDRMERYAEARKRNRRIACRQAGAELRQQVELLRMQRLFLETEMASA